MTNLSPQEQALLLDDILDAVFCVLDKASLASCIRVCRSWEPSAARALWRDMRGVEYGIKPLAMLVGELEPNAKPLVSSDSLPLVRFSFSVTERTSDLGRLF